MKLFRNQVLLKKLLRLMFWMSCCAFCLLFGTLEGVTWHIDYEKAQLRSLSEKKPILLFFNGSDWSGYAMRMKHEMLNDPAFQEVIGNKFICVEIDFPHHSATPDTLALQNDALKNRFYVKEIPSLLLVDGQERIIAQIGYLPETGQQLAQDLLKIMEQDAQLVEGLSRLDSTPENLRKLYHIAQELGRQSAIQKIIERGLQTADLYFLLEKYRSLVECGEMKTETCLELRKKILEITSAEAQEIHFTLALIDFQQLSQNNAAPDCAIAPLTEYLSRYREKDPANTWRIEMMIAQLYMETDQRSQALLHAEHALQSAPPNRHDEIAHSLEYIRHSPQNN